MTARSRGRRRGTCRVAVLLALVGAGGALLVGTADAAKANRPVLYVDRASPSCSEQGRGTSAQPFCTIGRAVLKVRPGATVVVRAGTYAEVVSMITSGTAANPIVFTAARGAKVVVSNRADGFRLWNCRWITVNGFTIRNTRGYGITVQHSSHITISQNIISVTGRQRPGQAKSGLSLSDISFSQITGNTVSRATSYGINLTDGSSGNLVRGNISYDNASVFIRAASGIRVYGSSGNTITKNVADDNEDSGIEFDHAPNNVVSDNVSYDNGDHGIDVYQSPGMRILRNTIYDNVTAGINVEGSSTGATILNNVSVNNAIGGPRNHSNIRVETGSTAGTTMDYDQVFLSDPDVLLIWDNVNYAALAAFQQATGQELHGVEALPGMIACPLLPASSTDDPLELKVPSREMCTMLRNARR